MKISTKGRYALRALTHLAVSHETAGNSPVSIKEISVREKISGRYLENIFVKLRKAGIVTSVKGEKGGFRLVKAPEKTNLYEIMKAVENDVAPSRCVVDLKTCGRAHKCGIRKIWVKLDRHVNDFMTNTTLAEATDMHNNSDKY
ncbi:MAG TPA: Rrf2 family transcriptional regulator [Candidatus Goldiibacteriota bacterium]|nr:Rrf2 family transcriptional regulator [Candidatus Goldiibacteriota bacterium]